MSDTATPSSILVQYRGEPVALVGATQVSFLDDTRHLPPGDPVVRVVAHMAYYAQLVMTGDMLTVYSDTDAERFARLALIDEAQLASLEGISDPAVAARFQVPVEEVVKARHELGGANGR